MYGSLRGRLPAKLMALFKFRDWSQDTVLQLAGIQMLSPLNSGRPSEIHSFVTVQLSEDAREFTLVDIGRIPSLAHLILEGDRRWLANSPIDVRTFHEINY